MPRTAINSWIFRLCAVGLIAAALYHSVELVAPDLVEPAPLWRHALFIAINLAAAAGFLARPRFFVWLFAVLAVQQLWGHGTYGIEVWRTQHRIDWASVIVLIAMPLLLALLVLDARKKE